MGVIHLLTKPITLRYAVVTGTDQYGRPVTSLSDIDTVCYPRQQATLVDGATVMERDDLRIALPADTVTSNLAAVILDGVEYGLNGVAHPQWNPRTNKAEFITLRVRRAVS